MAMPSTKKYSDLLHDLEVIGDITTSLASDLEQEVGSREMIDALDDDKYDLYRRRVARVIVLAQDLEFAAIQIDDILDQEWEDE